MLRAPRIPVPIDLPKGPHLTLFVELVARAYIIKYQQVIDECSQSIGMRYEFSINPFLNQVQPIPPVPDNLHLDLTRVDDKYFYLQYRNHRVIAMLLKVFHTAIILMIQDKVPEFSPRTHVIEYPHEDLPPLFDLIAKRVNELLPKNP